MTEAKGLEGIVAGKTSIATVGKADVGLTYRGYSILDLAAKSTFAEVAFLLLFGHLPKQNALSEFKARLSTYRRLPEPLKAVLECIPKTAHPMDVLRTGVSFLGTVKPETTSFHGVQIAELLLASLPCMLLYWHHYHLTGQRIETFTNKDLSIAAHFLTVLHGTAIDADQSTLLDKSLILYAEHEFNASTFSARTTAATLSDFYSAITSAIGTLRGPLHGGANEAAIELIESYTTPDAAEAGILEKLKNKSLIMGFGHRIYKNGDPRSPLTYQLAKTLAITHQQMNLLHIAERIEQVIMREKGLYPNLDFYSALLYRYLNIPTLYFTPLFAFARIAGWSAHIMEQRENNRLIRPIAEYIGPDLQDYRPIDKR